MAYPSLTDTFNQTQSALIKEYPHDPTLTLPKYFKLEAIRLMAESDRPAHQVRKNYPVTISIVCVKDLIELSTASKIKNLLSS